MLPNGTPRAVCRDVRIATVNGFLFIPPNIILEIVSGRNKELREQARSKLRGIPDFY